MYYTIAQRRDREVRKLESMRLPNNKPDDTYKEAKHVMRMYYRLCCVDDHLLYLENNYDMYDSPITLNLQDKHESLHSKVETMLNEKYNLTLVYFSWLPTICEMVNNMPYQRIERIMYG